MDMKALKKKKKEEEGCEGNMREIEFSLFATWHDC